MSIEETQKEERKPVSLFEDKDSKTGPVIGSIIIIIVILSGGLFFLDKMIKEKKQQIDYEKNNTIQTTENLPLEAPVENEIDQNINVTDIEFE